ncbi:MAG: DUF3899 domain-containing protein [Eubacteriales bacterium]|nr:DUF3899 domain-containing protein [Eubacteriales bacterium]
MDRPLWKLLLELAFGLVMALIVWTIQGLFTAQSAAEAVMYLCDGFFAAGALQLGWGGLRWTYNGGVMDGLGFTLKLGLARIRRSYEQDRFTFAQYRADRESKAKSPKYLLLSGLVYLALAFIFFGIYSAM